MRWRKERNHDKIFERVENRKYYEHIRKLMPTSPRWDVRTKDGFIAAFTRLPLLDPKQVLSAFPLEFLVDYHVYEMEKFEHRREAIRKERGFSEGVTIVHDMSGLGWSHAHTPALNAIKLIAALDADNYPEFVRSFFIINVPKLFTSLWAIVKTAFDKNTLKKVHIYGHSGWQEALAQVFDKEQLPDFLGGENDPSTYMGKGGDVTFDKAKLPRDAHDDILDNRKTTSIKRNAAFTQDVVVKKAHSQIMCEVHTKSTDLVLTIEYTKDGKTSVVYGPDKMMDSSVEYRLKSVVAKHSGKYTVKIENKTSLLRAKAVTHRIFVIEHESKPKKGSKHAHKGHESKPKKEGKKVVEKTSSD